MLALIIVVCIDMAITALGTSMPTTRLQLLSAVRSARPAAGTFGPWVGAEEEPGPTTPHRVPSGLRLDLARA